VTVPEIVVQTASVLPRWSKQACLMSIITPIRQNATFRSRSATALM
jgi:hypothetical protein